MKKAMSKIYIFILTLLSVMIVTGCGNSDHRKAKEYLVEEYNVTQTETMPNVILDCDMTYLGDDAMCLSILAQADKLGLIELLGITITGGNNFVSYGTNAALVQLDQIGRKDIQVVMAVDEELYWNFVTDLLCEMTETSDQDYSYFVKANDL